MASRYKLKDGSERWRARWYDATGERHTKAGFATEKDAETHEEAMRTDRRRGLLPLGAASKETLSEFVQWWWENDARHNLALATQHNYSAAYAAHIGPQLGDKRLSDLYAKPEILRTWRRKLDRRGKPHMAKLAAAVLSSILSAAEEEGRIPRNPMPELAPRRRRGRARKRGRTQPVKRARPVSPVGFFLLMEELRTNGGRRDPLDRQRDAAMVAVSFMAGFRVPSEVLGVRWRAVGQSRLHMEGRVSHGYWEETSKNYELRDVPLYKPLAGELRRLRDSYKAAGIPTSRDLLLFDYPERKLVPGEHWKAEWEDGVPWTDSKGRAWRAKVWQPAARRVAERWPDYAELAKATPYDGRHCAVSVWLAAGHPPIQVAAWAGHSLEMTQRTYGHLIREYEGRAAVPVEQQLAEAQAKAQDLWAAKLGTTSRRRRGGERAKHGPTSHKLVPARS